MTDPCSSANGLTCNESDKPAQTSRTLLTIVRTMPLQGWACTQIFEGHSHYVMQCVFNPKDTNTFASASLDRTVKVRLAINSPPAYCLTR